ncbi:SusC/RagA family TonB-linked outer membrane protein [Aliifodinibius sp. S!AR15-10]|nr:SusC/RagA family TonB-linked outer membrane protein [Aliifodinibius sp. S!AR15-10]
MFIIAMILPLSFSVNAQAQNEVSGTVTSAEDSSPLPGVNILVKGTSIGTTTGNEGNYQITVPSLSDTLVFSFIGFETQQIPVNGRSVVNVEMIAQTFTGDELVVTAFGLEREQKSLTYSTEGVGNDQLTEARELNVVNSLSGQVAGIQINQASTGVGGSSRVILRGNRSITGNSQPLYVVDGVPIRGEVSDLNPDDIENINVLKGPNAAALYGAEAQNGAIVITTKKGEVGDINVSMSSNFMFRDPMVLYDYQNQYGQGSGGVYDPSSEFNWGPPLDGRMVDFWSPDPERAGEQYALLPQPDNVEDVFQRGYNSSSNISASVGGQNTQTVFSYTYTDAAGIVPNNELQRHNLSIRVTSQLTDNLDLDAKVSYMRQNIDNQLPTGENFANPSRHAYRMPRNINTSEAENFEYTNSQGLNRQNFWNPGSNGGANPYWTINRNVNENQRERVIAMSSLTYDFNDNLSLMVRASYDGEAGQSETKWYNDSYIIADNGQYSLSKTNAYEWNGDFLLSYNRDLTEDWYVEANVGANIKKERNTGLFSNTGNALTVPNFFTISNTQNVVSTQSVGSPRDVQSLYAFGQIGWKNSVFLDITGRNDWSSTLPADSRSYFYPSVGLSAVLSDLIPEFPDVFSYAQVRASWARVGNSAPPFQLQRTASITSGGNNGFLQLSTTLPNEELKPEETESIELGVDVRFFEGRLGLDVTGYKTNTRNQLFTVALPVGSGASQFFTNGGNVSNKGIEVLLKTTPVQTPDFSWDFNTNWSTNENMVESISDERPSLTIAQDFLREFRIEEGEPFGQVYSRGYQRDDQGRVIVGSNGMPLITDGLNVAVANFNPDWQGGIRNSFFYKNYSLSFLIEHRQGGSIASLTTAVLFADGLTKQTLQGRDGGLIFGDNFMPEEEAVKEDGSPNDIPIDAETFWRGVGGRNAPVGEVFTESATNTRLREVTLGYTLPQSVISGLPFANVKISLVGRNLLFIYKKSDNLDPDQMVGTNAAAEGFESFTAPPTRTFGANLQIDFK